MRTMRKKKYESREGRARAPKAVYPVCSRSGNTMKRQASPWLGMAFTAVCADWAVAAASARSPRATGLPSALSAAPFLSISLCHSCGAGPGLVDVRVSIGRAGVRVDPHEETHTTSVFSRAQTCARQEGATGQVYIFQLVRPHRSNQSSWEHRFRKQRIRKKKKNPRIQEKHANEICMLAMEAFSMGGWKHLSSRA